MNRSIAPVMVAAFAFGACTPGTPSTPGTSGTSECEGVVAAFKERTRQAQESITEDGRASEAGDFLAARAARDAAARDIEIAAILIRDNEQCFGPGQRAAAEQILRDRDRRGSS